MDPRSKIMEAAGVISTNPALSMRSPNTPHDSVVSSRSFADLSPQLTAAE
jgi:hypothetical protein